MRESSNPTHWTRHFVYRAEHTRTTWKFRIGFVTLIVFAVWFTRGWWTVAVASSLVCDENAAPSDAILVENFDPSYHVFERAGQLRRDGVAARLLVPVQMDQRTLQPTAVESALTELLARVARVGSIEIVPVKEIEPISLTAARDVVSFARKENIHSVTVVSPLFRSRRSALVYGATLGRAGVTVRCEGVEEIRTPHTWTNTWHGVEDVAEQWMKLQYYRFYVLPFKARIDSAE